MARLADIIIDCAHPGRLARFWAEVLDDHHIAPYDDEELARLRDLGIDDPMDDPTVLVDAGATQTRLWFQRVPEPKVVKNRVHLDLRADDMDAETGRLVSLGAVVAADQPDPSWIVLMDPEGNEFCLIGPSAVRPSEGDDRPPTYDRP